MAGAPAFQARFSGGRAKRSRAPAVSGASSGAVKRELRAGWLRVALAWEPVKPVSAKPSPIWRALPARA